LRDVWASYSPDSPPVLKGIDLTVERGDAMSIIGSSGSGKTTLLRVLLGYLKPSRGRAEVLGAAPGSEHVRARVGYIPQQLGLVLNLSALDNALLGSLSRVKGLRSLTGAFPRREVEQARESLKLVGLADKADKKAWELSGGERQRVAIARTLVQRAEVLLADEFLSDLDHHRVHDILDMLREVNRRGVTMIMVTHDLVLASEWGQRAVVIHEGKKLADVRDAAVTATSLAEMLT